MIIFLEKTLQFFPVKKFLHVCSSQFSFSHCQSQNIVFTSTTLVCPSGPEYILSIFTSLNLFLGMFCFTMKTTSSPCISFLSLHQLLRFVRLGKYLLSIISLVSKRWTFLHEHLRSSPSSLLKEAFPFGEPIIKWLRVGLPDHQDLWIPYDRAFTIANRHKFILQFSIWLETDCIFTQYSWEQILCAPRKLILLSDTAISGKFAIIRFKVIIAESADCAT